MAKVKHTKKDIRYLTEQVISDAILITEDLEKEDDKKEVVEVIASIVNLHNNLISKVNNIEDGLTTPQIKLHFKSIYDELLSGCDEAYKVLGKFLA